MGHQRLTEPDLHGAEMWTGEDFDYLYVRIGDKEITLPPAILLDELTSKLRREVVSEVETGEHDWKRLARVLDILKSP